jgi:hypothetical protein
MAPGLTGTGGPWRVAWRGLGASAWALRALATGLVLSLLLNVVLLETHTPPGADRRGQLRLAFAKHVQEQELRTLLLDLQATIIAGPSQEGVYLVQVPLAALVPRLRGSGEEPTTTDPMRLLLEELRAHPAVRLAEPVTAPQTGER